MADQNNDRSNEQQLDEMLDSLLTNYASAEPRPGLETRILAQVRVQGKKQNRGSNLQWVLTAAALASAVIVTILIYRSRPESRPASSQVANSPQRQNNPTPQLQKTIPDLSASERLTHRGSPDRRHIVRMKEPMGNEVAVVKQDVFPSPSPLSAQEKLLFRYLSRTPREELIAQSRPDPPSDDTDEDEKEPRSQNLTQILQRNTNTR